MSIEVYIKKCIPIPIVHYSIEINGSEIKKPKWKFLFTLLSNSDLIDEYNEKAHATGSVMDLVIGFDAETYERISIDIPELNNFFVKYFENSKFMIEIAENSIKEMMLPPGNNLTFVRWLSMQPNFDYSSFCDKAFSFDDDGFLGEEI